LRISDFGLRNIHKIRNVELRNVECEFRNKDNEDKADLRVMEFYCFKLSSCDLNAGSII